MSRLIQIRTYKLHEGSGSDFHQLMSTKCLPLLLAGGTDVVGFGPSAHSSDAYYLIRSYDSIEDLERSQDAFYGSAVWREGPREAVLALIDSYLDAVVELEPAAIETIRNSQPLDCGVADSS